MNGNGDCPAGTSHFRLATLASGFTGFFVSQRRKENTLKTYIIQRCAGTLAIFMNSQFPAASCF